MANCAVMNLVGQW